MMKCSNFLNNWGSKAFPYDRMVFHVGRSDVYIIVTLKKVTEENQAAIELLRKLVEAQGLFLL